MHSRLGHASSPVVKSVLSRHKLSFSSESNNSGVICDACQMAKSHQLSYPKSNSVSSKPFELVFTDVWGPAPTSVGRHSYYISFIDDFSKFTWIYLLRFKSEVFQCFRDFQNMVERQFSHKILAVQSDWGGEYQSLNAFFKRLGIAHHVSCPHAHQQNGSAERKHRHIVEVGLSLLAHASMPLKYWDQAFLTAVFIINRLPSKTIHNNTPHDLLLGSSPDYSFFRTFGCAVWPNLRPYNTKKLQFRSKRCVFLGYSNLHKGFKCLEPSTGRIYVSRDVVFDETIYPFSELHSNAGARLRAELDLLPDILKNPDPSLEFGSANMHDHHLINCPTNAISSVPSAVADAGQNLEQFGEEMTRPRHYFMQPSGVPRHDNAGAAHGDDTSVPCTGPAAQSSSGLETAAPGSAPESGSESPPFDPDAPTDVSGLFPAASPGSSTSTPAASGSPPPSPGATVDPVLPLLPIQEQAGV